MSIALIGPKKYDFQDLVCIKYMLQFYKFENIHFLVEPKGGEDAELTFTDTNNQQLRFEIQVKGSEKAVTIAEIAECLAHFPEKISSNFLLERIISDDYSHAVLVMSGRSTDSLQKFLPKGKWDGKANKTTSFTKKDAEEILIAIKSYSESFENTKLKTERKKHINQFIESVDIDQVKKSLSRLIVIDNVNDDSLTDASRKILRKDFHIPDDIFIDVINSLTEVIKEGKQCPKGINLPFFQKLNDKPVLSVRPKRYTPRGEEEAWISQLKSDNVLLFSGTPRVGKSNTAKWIGSEFQLIGYSILLTQHIDEAERFLLDSVSAPRLVVLDDPLGGIHSINKPFEKLSSLKKLVCNLRTNRKLIVAQGQECLLEITEAETLTEASIDHNDWINLTNAPKEFLLNYWESLRSDYSISTSLFSLIRSEIDKNELYIEPGCLTYIAVEHKKIATCTDIKQVLRFARRDANDLGKALAEDGCKNVLIGLALTTSHLEKVNEKELAFSLTNEKPRAYGYSNFLGTGISFGSDSQVEKIKFPKYQEIPKLPEKDLKSLNILEVRQIIEFDDIDQATFTHPFYRSAAESLINVNTRNSFPKIEKLLSNGLFCLSPATAKASARNLYWIFEQTKKEKDKTKLIELAESGLDSSYPSVRDICFEFLIDVTPNFDDKYKNEQSKWIYKINGNDLTSLEWVDGQPWYPMGEKRILNSGWPFDFNSDSDKAKQLLDDINNDAVMLISSKDAYDILTYLENEPDSLTHSVISRVLSVDEGLIRALGAKVWLKVNRQNDEPILDRIYSDLHPAVAEATIKSTVRSWGKFNAERQDTILSGLKKMVHQPVLANTIIDKLVVFEREHIMGKNPPWEVFSILLPIALLSISPSKKLNFGRLDAAVDAAIKELNPASILIIIESWITLIEKIAINEIPDDYALSVTDILLHTIQSNSSKRVELVTRLLSLNGTGPLVRVISDLIRHWDKLSSPEKDIVFSLIKADRKDKYWIKATILTANKAPRELLKLVLSDDSNYVLQPKIILNLKPEKLKAAFQMYIGKPQPLWWIGTHHREQKVWNQCIDFISSMPEHPLFHEAFDELLILGNRKQLCSVISNFDKKYADEIFKLMLEYNIDANPDFMPEVWSCLFDLAPTSDTCSAWIKQIASNASNILDDLTQAKKIIPKSYLNEFYSYFKADIAILNFLNELKKIKDGSEMELSKDILNTFIPTIKELFKVSPPLHYSTCHTAKSLLQNIGYSTLEIKFVHDRTEFLLKESQIKKVYTKEKITDWIF